MTSPTNPMIEAIASEENIPLYKRFTEDEAADILDVSVPTLRRIRERGEIAYIRVSERRIRYFGLHLCEYFLSKVEKAICRETPNTDSSSDKSGAKSKSPASQDATQALSGDDALAAARRILDRPPKS